MKVKQVFGLGCVCLMLLLATTVSASNVRISAAASLTDAVKELVGLYQEQNPEIELLPNFAASGALAKQITAGAPADIYISANPKWMEYLQRQGLIADETVQVLVANSLVFVGSPEGGITSLGAVTTLQRAAICSPKSSPAGKYAEQALMAVGAYPQLVDGEKLILAKDVRQALLYADRGEVDGAFIYHTDALLAKQAKILFAVPQDLYPQVLYPVALTRSGVEKLAAEKFFDYLQSAEARQVFRNYGFVVK